MVNTPAEQGNGGVPERKPALPVRLVKALWRVASDPSYRHMLRLLRRPPADMFQPFNDTLPDRYPAIFKFVQGQLGADRDLKLLSFGCATGEEVFTLRRYFPRASIEGLDINAGSIAVACRRLRASPDPGLSFACVASTQDEPAGAYDAVFCMAVLRHGDLAAPGVTRCDHLIPFERFAAAVADLHRCLKPGGLLVVRHSNFRVCDAPAGAGFETLLRVPAAGARKTPIFGPDNVLIPDADYPDTVFRKR